MDELTLKTVTRTQGNNQALKDGTVKPKSFAFDFVEVPVLIDAFRRMVRRHEFDICEMAITTYVCARAYGKRFTALPVFLVRAFHHGAILYNAKLGIRTPKDLEGRKVGVNRGYTVTTGLWHAASLPSSMALTSARSPGSCPATSMWPNTSRPPTSFRSRRGRRWPTC